MSGQVAILDEHGGVFVSQRNQTTEARHPPTVYSGEAKSIFQACLSSFAKMWIDIVHFLSYLRRVNEKNVFEAFGKFISSLLSFF